MMSELRERIAEELHRIDCEMDAPEDEDPTLYDKWWHAEANRGDYRVRADRILALLDSSEPVAWMVHYGCGCDIPCTTKVIGTWCPKHDEDGPVVGHTALSPTPTPDPEGGEG